MFYFLKKLVLFILPIGLLFIFPIIVLFLGREYYSVNQAIQLQSKDPEALFGLSYKDLSIPYKKVIAQSNPQAEVVVLGASRGVEFKKDFFKSPDTFLNLAVHDVYLDDLQTFITTLPKDSNVKFVIISLEPSWFKADYVPYSDEGNTISPLTWFNNAWRSTYADYFSGKFTLGKLFEQSIHTNNIGLNALMNRNGFSLDGTYYYGQFANDPNAEKSIEAQINELYSIVQKDRSAFIYGDTIPEPLLNRLDYILSLYKARGIEVVGLLPPYPNVYYQEIMGTSDGYKETAIELPVKLNDIFSKYGFGFYDFSDIRILGATDGEFIDALHGTDKLYLRMVIYMAERNQILNEYVNVADLKKTLQDTKGNFLTF